MSDDVLINRIKGIGPKREVLLKQMGIRNILDLLWHFPRRYEDRSNLKSLNSLIPGEVQSTVGQIKKVEELRSRNNLRIIKAIISDHTDIAAAVWFNQPFLKKQLREGMNLALTGKVKEGYKQKEIYVAEFELIENDQESYTGDIIPFYPSTEGLSQKFWREIQKQALEKYLSAITDIFSEEKCEKYDLMPIKEALTNIHFPKEYDILEKARYRLVFEELFLLQMALYMLRKDCVIKDKGISQKKEHPKIKEFIKQLPFALTKAQERVIGEISRDMEAKQPMRRLIQGDVGSGKTVVAAIALLKTVGNGYLGVFMAPTEILARQQYASISTWFKPYGIETSLLIGSMNSQEKKAVLERIAEGKTNIVIGTHVLIQEGVTLEKAGLIVIDEQHRFGVKQRETLEKKANSPDVLVMTATPIPRTLALTFYGDLDISTLDELPPGRKKVETYCIKSQSKQKIFEFIYNQLNKNAQIYVVCPLVEESETIDIANAENTAVELAEVLAPFRVGLIHGKMTTKEKDAVMEGFRLGNIRILVSTTVIEVGVNVPNATVMIIEDADRFGLAQLHQLRGRVGRSEIQSYCILVTKTRNPVSLERLKLLTNIHDGFVLAEEDLKLRGPGEFLGIRQHGLHDFKLADLSKDTDILLKTRKLIQEIINEDPYLRTNKNVIFVEKTRDILNKIVKV